MSEVKYKLNQNFKSFKKGKTFVRIAVYGDGFIHDEKLQLHNSINKKTICVKKEELDEFFTLIKHNI